MKDQPPLPRAEDQGNAAEVFAERHHTYRGGGLTREPYFEIPPSVPHAIEPPFEFQEFCNESYGETTNNLQQYNFPNLGPGRSCSHEPSQVNAGPESCRQNGGPILRGTENHAEVSGPRSRPLEGGRPETRILPGPAGQYKRERALSSEQSGSPAPMPTARHYSAGNAPQAAASASRFGPFGGKFFNSERASLFRKSATRFNRKPYRPPETDMTISEIDRHRLHHVERIYNAMTRADVARDNNGSIAMKRWVHGAYYDSSLVEAYAHKVLDCLLAQAKEGFRGWTHNDYVTDERKGEDEDRDVSCAGRLDNVIRALEEEKTICEDVMNSACQIRMFVNAPKAYANRKYQNRVGNSKRGRTKESTPDAGAKPSKMRKPNPKQTTQVRQALAGDDQYVSQTPKPSVQEQRVLRRYATPPTHLVGSPIARYLPNLTPVGSPAEHVVAAPSPAFASHHVNAMSPPPHALHIPRMTSMPPQNQLPFLSPPPLSVGHYSAPVTPDETMSLHSLPHPWSSNPLSPLSYSTLPGQEDLRDPIFGQTWAIPHGHQESHIASANLFDEHPDAALIDFSQQTGGPNQSVDFEDFWKGQEGVQKLPYDHN